jgi:putative polyketide hydroxylase
MTRDAPVREEFPVLIVGGGVVGLTASLFLAQHGVRSLLCERHPSTSIHPRARGVNGRTAELLRELGLEEAVRSQGAKLAPAVGIYRGASLREVLLGRREGGWLMRRLRARTFKGQASRRSPTGPCRCTQDEMEPILLAAARARGVDARLFSEVEAIEQDRDGVAAQVLDRGSGERRRVRARYVIAADGARSRTRDALGILRSTALPGSQQMNLYFRADLRSLVRGREFSMCLVERPGLRALFASINNADLWVLHVAYSEERGESPADFVPERCVELIRAATGVPDLDIELKGALPWESALRIADQYRSGRVFLAGDAAHIMPPWGGFGANAGIQDAHNLAWKLALVLQGSAGERLLDSYQCERRPVALAVGAIAASMNDPRGLIAINRSPLATIWGMRKVFPYLGVGYGYASEAIKLEPGVPPGPGSKDLAGRPGTRAPHVWLERAVGGGRLSSLDLFGRRYVLLVGPRGDVWREAALELAARSAVPLDTVRLGTDVIDVERRWPRAFGVGPDGAALVRPDGFVAWRARRAEASRAAAGQQLGSILQQTLCRTSDAG